MSTHLLILNSHYTCTLLNKKCARVMILCWLLIRPCINNTNPISLLFYPITLKFLRNPVWIQHQFILNQFWPIHFNLIESLKIKLPHSGVIIFEDFLCLSVNFSYNTKDSRLKSASAHFNKLKKCLKSHWSHVRVIVFEGARSFLRCI